MTKYSNPQEGSSNRKVVGQFFGLFDDNWEDHFPKDHPAPFDKVDYLYVAFAHTYIDDNGKPYIDFEHLDIQPREPERFSELAEFARAMNPDIKIILSLGWTSDHKDLPPILKDPSYYATTVVKLLQDHDLDGFDIDYESTGLSSKDDFNTIVEAIGDALAVASGERGSKYLFTMSPALTDWRDSQNVDGSTANKYFDFVNLQLSASPEWAQELGIDKSKITLKVSSESIDEWQTRSNQETLRRQARTIFEDDLAGIYGWRLDNDTTVNGQPPPTYLIAEEMWQLMNR